MKKLIVVLSIFFLSACAPTISIELEESIDTVEVFDTHVVKGCLLNKDGTIYRMKIDTNNVNTDILGTYTIDYYYELNEETYTCQRVVFVVDQTPPTLNLHPGIDTIKVGENWEDSGIMIVDNYDTDLDYELSNTIDNEVVGNYEVIYTVTDHSGNEATITRIVHVIE